MSMKDHILTALQEQFDLWETLLSRLDEQQILTPLEPSPWAVRDEMAHLWAWQQRTIARVDAVRLDQEPRFPQWPAGLDPNGEDSLEQINDWIYETNRVRPWAEVHQNWRAGYLRMLELAGAISERDLLNSGRYPWLAGHSIMMYVLASYDHHQEHYEKLVSWLQAHGKLNLPA